MKGTIKAEYKHKFNPTVSIIVGGNPVKVTLKEAETKAEKFAFTPLSIFYENLSNIQQEAKQRSKKVVPIKIDMNNVKRGDAFDPSKNVLVAEISAFREKQEENFIKFSRRNKVDTHKIIMSKKRAKTKTKTNGNS